MMRHTFYALACLAALGACSNPLKTGRFLIDPPDQGVRVPDRIGTAELRDVSLPDYASGDEVAWQTADGAVRMDTKNLWADKPQRAFTLTLARTISDISGATVIAEPWPLAEPPRRKLEVRVEKALAMPNGVYRLTGRYFVSDNNAGGANQARSFDISVPLTSDKPGEIARAQSQAIAQLARQIATLSGPGRSIKTSAPKLDTIFSAPLPGFDGM
ncbi:PqiC family protein [Paracoccus aminophilus]|uniref:ABC-type transport auxiliary lipoprotein component domain-containing protein n=1 Tax=Paracoccus aminophilus JCM 7686 TaxID=1367847 RepID=S5Y6U7_PARAH|nr:PqiC family protein [Paracoccus aminophilus]AGT11305.1 hypothetical protein JCM7686_pAMI5p239 [Paracoccus aminophilus JCM 7686]